MPIDESTRIGLHTTTLIQESIRHADAKIATMSGLVCGSAVFLAGQLGGLGRLGRAGPYWLSAAVVLTVLAMTALAVATWYLGDGLRQRLGTTESTGRLGLTAQACEPDPPAAVSSVDDDIRRLNRALARIAIIKHERVRRSLVCAAVALAAIAGAALCLALPPGPVS
jgi:hypothetical protein